MIFERHAQVAAVFITIAGLLLIGRITGRGEKKKYETKKTNVSSRPFHGRPYFLEKKDDAKRRRRRLAVASAPRHPSSFRALFSRLQVSLQRFRRHRRHNIRQVLRDRRRPSPACRAFHGRVRRLLECVPQMWTRSKFECSIRTHQEGPMVAKWPGAQLYFTPPPPPPPPPKKAAGRIMSVRALA